ncbi:hypothetical protein NQ314_008872 [Rhamnusium bicolor]|uniref:Uncharacterized protein n=1 Tax=Rhamnusium bicolor TaxID=1586634 RepID=A0AAV8Y558_9CUCU|nr:hypothetical protein NQ314_008872 [Rhamnusium bicolor]
MSGNNPGTSRSRPPPGFLTRVPISELKSIRVAVRRGNITTSNSSPGPIERIIDDPKQIVALVHIKKVSFEINLTIFEVILPFSGDARNSRGIFDRDDVLVNQEDRFVLADANKEKHKSRKSKSYSRSKSKSPRKDRSASSSYRRSKSSSRSRSGGRRSLDKGKGRRQIVNTERRKSLDRENDRRNLDIDKRSLERRRSLDKGSGRNLDREKERSVDRDRDKRLSKSRPYSREREQDERYRRRSMTPLRPGEYRPSHAEVRRRSRSRDREHPHEYRSRSQRSRSPSRERHKPSVRSQSPGYQKPSTSRKPSRSPRRSITPTHRHDRPRSPKYGESSKSRRSRSPIKPNKPYYVEKRGKERSPGYKSPTEKSRRSRSPSRYEKERNRSRSPNKYPEGGKSRSKPSTTSLVVDQKDIVEMRGINAKPDKSM